MEIILFLLAESKFIANILGTVLLTTYYSTTFMCSKNGNGTGKVDKE